MHKSDKIFPITNVEINCEDDELVEVPVIEGVAYAPIFKNNYDEILAALKETPEELEKNKNVKLIYV